MGPQGQAAQGSRGSVQLVEVDRLPGGAGDPDGAILPSVAGRLLPPTPIAEGVALVLRGPRRADPIIGRHGADAVRPHPWWVVLVILGVLGGVGAVILRGPAGHGVEPRGTESEHSIRHWAEWACPHPSAGRSPTSEPSSLEWPCEHSGNRVCFQRFMKSHSQSSSLNQLSEA